MAGKKYILPLIPLRGLTVFPGMIIHFDAARSFSVAAAEAAMKSGGEVFLTAQKDFLVEDIQKNDIYSFGVIAEIKQILRLPDGSLRLLVEGITRAKCSEIYEEDGYFKSVCSIKKEKVGGEEIETDVLIYRLKNLIDEYVSHFDEVSPEMVAAIFSIDNPGELSDIAAANLPIKPVEKQKALEELNVQKRMENLIAALEHENKIMDIEQTVSDKLRDNLDRNQREYVLREHIKVLREELGEGESAEEETDKFKKRISERKLPEIVLKKLHEEVEKLLKLPPQSQEYSVIEGYIEAVLELPWDKADEDRTDIKYAKEVLQRDHFGLEKVKESILEMLAVKKLTGKVGGSVMCLVGPPGTGKTSIVHSLAEAMGRKYVRVSLGGVQNEAEIRGHRKTYVGSMPGRIMAALKQAGTKNPVILLDEIDKISSELRGDPAAALLEVLDPEQNKGFRDHFIELPFDLSEVLFVATANSVEGIPRPLYDRMEMIEVSGYSDEEKLVIAKKYILPKQKKLAGLESRALKISDSVLRLVIEGYTRESGVRGLERKIRAICRKAAMEITEDGKDSVSVTKEKLKEYLGGRDFVYDSMNKGNIVGVATGLAWTEVGGDTLFIEVNVMEGSGKLELTGNLGDVMKESAKAAHSCLRANAEELGLEKDFYKTKDIHIHIPEGAIPKDGPSAGITMATAMFSALSGIPVKKNVAMTGEITLRGRVLPIGGLKEKSLAAYRMGIDTIIIPFENKKDYEELPENVRKKIKFVFAKELSQVFETALEKQKNKNKAEAE